MQYLSAICYLPRHCLPPDRRHQQLSGKTWGWNISSSAGTNYPECRTKMLRLLPLFLLLALSSASPVTKVRILMTVQFQCFELTLRGFCDFCPNFWKLIWFTLDKATNLDVIDVSIPIPTCIKPGGLRWLSGRCLWPLGEQHPRSQQIHWHTCRVPGDRKEN